ncbi:MAG: hypothetical protein CFE21_00045 [Bacteroidetes bacterium B1(2017)]|nr:MAG: hypothetical protein CFE21_00045 [Bacteroidetes bacterium B1(2017)]
MKFYEYRFSFNGQERDDEVAGLGNINTAEFWEYDTRLGRRWNLDPEPHLGLSDYSCFGNGPIINVDPLGNYFFGLFGSTSEQRRIAKDFAKSTNGIINNLHSKIISVDYIYIKGVCDQTTGQIEPTVKGERMYFTKEGQFDLDGDGEVGWKDFNYLCTYKSKIGIGDYDMTTGYPRGSGVIEPPPIDPIDVMAGLGGGILKSSARKSLVQLNKKAGDEFRDELAEALKNAGRDVEKEVYKQTPFGGRIIDIEVKMEGKVLGGIETKLGKSPYKPSQRAKDFWLKKVKGYQVDVVREPSRTGKK